MTFISKQTVIQSEDGFNLVLAQDFCTDFNKHRLSITICCLTMPLFTTSAEPLSYVTSYGVDKFSPGAQIREKQDCGVSARQSDRKFRIIENNPLDQ